MKKTQKTGKEDGIVLLEAIVAIGVLATIFTATMALSMASIGGVRNANDQLVATYLAQDALELVIAKRQYNHDHNRPWLEGLENCTATNPCSADFDFYLANPLPYCGTTCSLYLDGNKYSSDSSGTLSPYSRYVVVEPLGGTTPFEARVTVHVSWNDKKNTYDFPLVLNVYNEPN